MRKISVFIVAGVVIVIGIAFFGSFAGWWDGSTEMGVLPDDSGGVVVRRPSQEDFSDDEAYEEYQAHWRDPYWSGEYPEGYRYKLAYFKDEKWASLYSNGVIAGCVQWTFEGSASENDAAELATLVNAEEHYLIRESKSNPATGPYQYLLLYFSDDTDIKAKVDEVRGAVEASNYRFRGDAGWVEPSCGWLPHPDDPDS